MEETNLRVPCVLRIFHGISCLSMRKATSHPDISPELAVIYSPKQRKISSSMVCVCVVAYVILIRVIKNLKNRVDILHS